MRDFNRLDLIYRIAVDCINVYGFWDSKLTLDSYPEYSDIINLVDKFLNLTKV